MGCIGLIVIVVVGVLIIASIGAAVDKNTPISLDIIEPIGDVTVETDQIVVKVKLEPSYALVELNGQLIFPDFENGGNVFVKTFKLDMGENKYVFTSNNSVHSDEASIVITRVKSAEDIEAERIKEEEELKKKEEEEQKKIEMVEKLQKEEEEWNNSYAGQICAERTDWQKYECEYLADNMIWIGMSYDMLVYERGYPTHTTPSDYGYGIQYQWCWMPWNNGPSCFYDDDNDGLIDSYN
ncbi:MAG: hypothetical protein KKF65_05650 [Nanoarchaeota archaeon]|nr:hypothetical protein [Nanoarchaeota archaeon]